MPKKSAKDQTPAKGNGAQPQVSDGIEFLKGEHAKIRALVDKLDDFEANDDATSILRELCRAWTLHARLESDVAFPKLREAGLEESVLDEAQIEADIVALLLSDLIHRESDDPFFEAVARAALRAIPRTIEFEEAEPAGWMAKAKAAEPDVEDLAKALHAEQDKAKDRAEDERGIPQPRHLRGAGPTRTMETRQMPSYYRERDEQGRFVSEDDDRRGRSYGARRYSSRSRDDDDDNRGWYGEPRRHAEAARRGWDERRSSGRYEDDDDRRDMRRSRGYDDYDDDRRRYRGRDDDDYDDRRMSRGRHGGWFGDSEGHAQAARRGWDNPDHGRSGWFGDPEGHSEASRRGWDDRRSSSRYDDDYDYDRRRRR